MTKTEEAFLGEMQVNELKELDLSDLLYKLHQMRKKQGLDEQEQEEKEFRLRLNLRKNGLKDGLSADNPLMGEFEMKPSL
jgi:CRISPR/Cas system CMR-associated protein Cmr1 (group 7 of RAMP superfamily)